MEEILMPCFISNEHCMEKIMNIKKYHRLEKTITNIIVELTGDILMIVIALASAYYVIVALML